MIRLYRPEEPPSLKKNKAKWLKALLFANGDKARKLAESKYRHRSIKDALIRMSAGKCSYCESKLLHIDYGDIEHFRPKAIERYREKTFEWSNLHLSCKVCNGAEYKGIVFPTEKDGGPPIDPAREEPSSHLTFIFDRSTKLATVGFTTRRGEVTRDLFGLNRADLRTRRSEAVKKLVVLSELAKTNPAAQELLAEAKQPDAEYSAFAKCL